MRFGGIERLYGEQGFHRIRKAHVAVIGIGGVGSWAAESLARSGVGQLTLVDLDDVCLTNVNRQVHAIDGQIGHPKVQAMAERVRLISPELVVHCEPRFFTKQNAETLLSRGFDYVVDAIDSVPDKALLVHACHERHLPVVVSGGAGGKRDPAQVRIADLAKATNDALVRKLRRILRDEYGFPKGEDALFGIDCVYSTENPVFPWSDGTICATREPGSSLRLDCASGFGTAGFVTGTFGLVAASVVINHLAAGDRP